MKQVSCMTKYVPNDLTNWAQYQDLPKTACWFCAPFEPTPQLKLAKICRTQAIGVLDG